MDLNEFYDPIRELMVSALRAILQVDLAESEDSISKIVETILKQITLESDGSVRLFLNPSDASILKDFEPDTENSVKILSDPRLTPGSARAVMGDSIIESMKENRVQQIVDQIMGDTQKKSASRSSQNRVPSKKKSVKKKRRDRTLKVRASDTFVSELQNLSGGELAACSQRAIGQSDQSRRDDY